MAKVAKDIKVRIEGDFNIYRTPDGSEYRRWAEGNSQGKRANALAERHPKSHEAIRTAAEGRALGRLGNEIKAERWRLAATAGMVDELRKKGRIRKDGDAEAGYGAIVGAQSGVAVSDTREATGAARFVAESIGAMTRGGGQVQAVQVNVQIGESVRDRYLDPEVEVVDAVPAEQDGEEEEI